MPKTCMGFVIGSTNINAFLTGIKNGKNASIKLPKKLPLIIPYTNVETALNANNVTKSLMPNGMRLYFLNSQYIAAPIIIA